MIEEEIFCDKCKKEINKKIDNYTEWTDWKLGKVTDKKHWHTNCFIAWFTEKKAEGAMQLYNQSMSTALKQLKPMLAIINES